MCGPTGCGRERGWGLALGREGYVGVRRVGLAAIIRGFGRGAAAQREAVLARFGMIAPTAKSARSTASTVNARTETAATRPSSRNAYVQRQWCTVPAQCLYEPSHAHFRPHAERPHTPRPDQCPLRRARSRAPPRSPGVPITSIFARPL